MERPILYFGRNYSRNLVDRAQVKFDKDQAAAVKSMLQDPISITTGGPGCGKSTCVASTLDKLDQHNIEYRLAAPTGKAARRLTETTGRHAETIHRLLGYNPALGGFEHARNHPIDTDVVIIDESSMISLELASALLQAIDARMTRVVFIGDANQLPPVGPGAFFRDLIESGVVPTTWLKTVHRSAQKSWIYRNAPRILAGSADLERDDCDDFEWHCFEEPEYITQVVNEIIKTNSLAGTDTQVIAPLKKRTGGVVELNSSLQKFLNPSNAVGWQVYDHVIRQGDRVMQTRNNYILGVFNGEVGEVKDMTGARMTVQFDNMRVEYDHNSALDLQLAYCMTIHKTQGSQFNNVIVVCHSNHNVMLTRQLLYTAVTRAKERVYLVGDEAGLNLALKTVKDIQRKTLLKQRILGEDL